jgi:hypothetical protein
MTGCSGPRYDEPRAWTVQPVASAAGAPETPETPETPQTPETADQMDLASYNHNHRIGPYVRARRCHPWRLRTARPPP